MIQSFEWWNRWLKLWEEIGYVDNLYQHVWWRSLAELFGAIGLDKIAESTYPLWSKLLKK